MESSGYRKITRRKGACVNCRQRKVRCDGAATCSQCLKLNLKCGYSNGQGPRNEKPRRNTLDLETNDPQRVQNDSSRGPRHSFDFTISTTQGPNGSGFSPYILDSVINPSAAFATPSIDGSGQHMITPDLSDGVSPWSNSIASGAEDHPLDHSIDLGHGLQQERVWPEELRKDFSSFAPIRFIGRCSGDEDLQHRIWSKVRGSARVDDPHARRTSEALLSYAQPETLEFIDLFFQENYGYPNFVGKQMVLEILMEALRSSSDMDQGALVLLNSVLAIGCRNALRKHRLNTEKHAPITATRPLQYFQCALIHHNALSTGPPSLLKLQGLIAMILFVHRRHDAVLTRALLSQAISMISDLSLTNPSNITGPNAAANLEDLERMFWLLYSIEKPHALRFGTHSVVDDDLLVYHAPSKKRTSLLAQETNSYSGWEIVNYRYARLCSAIVKTLYSHTSFLTASDVSSAIERLTNMLESWRLSLPAAYRPDKGLEGPECHEHAGDSIIRSDIALRYSEASLAIHRWILAVNHCDQDLASAYALSKSQCAVVAKSVLGAAHSCRTDSGTDWPVVMLPALAAMVLYIMMRQGEEGDDCLSYLGIAAGFFGKLRVKAEDDPDLFPEMSELLLAAHPKASNQLQTPPSSMRGSVEGDFMSMHLDHKGMCDSTTGQLGCFDFPQDISESIFDITSLDDIMMPS